MKRQLISAVPLFAVLVAPMMAQAATATATMPVSLTLNANCTLTASALTFPAATSLATALTANTTVGVTCTNTTPYNIGLDAGATPGSTIAARLLAGSTGNTATVQFKLFRNAGLTDNWGNTVGTDTQTGTGSGSLQNVTVYGQIPIQVAPKPDTYSASITATVTF